MGKATIVSTLPFELVEPKPGLIPSMYVIPAAKDKDSFSLLTVEDGYHLVLMPLTDDKTPPMRMTDTAEKIAQSLIDDYTNSCLAVDYNPVANGSLPVPGLFWIEGKLSITEIGTKFPHKVRIAKNNTLAWFERLVKLADDDWSRNKTHRTITDLQRNACNYLNLPRDWNFDVFQALNNLCWSCKNQINPSAIICSHCKAILNQAEFEKNKSRFVTV